MEQEKKTQVEPLNDRVLVKRVEATQKSKGGIIIPETAQEPPLRGIVLAIGKGAILRDGGRRPLDVKVGDEVIFSKYAGTEIELDGESMLIMTENDIQARVPAEGGDDDDDDDEAEAA